MAKSPRFDYRPAVAAYLAAWLALAWPWLSGAVTIPYDAKAHFHAQLQFLATAIHSGQSPFWAPHVFAGTPQIADPQSLIFSPALLLAMLSPSPSFWLLDVYTLGLVGLGGLAMLLVVRDRGWHPAGAVVAAIVFAFGASAAWRIQHIGQIQSYAMFAIAFWLLARALDRASPTWGGLAGLAAGLMLVEPDQVALMGAYVLAAAVLAHWFERGPGAVAGRARRTSGALTAGALAGAIVVVVPLTMTMLFVSASNRPAIPFAEAALGSIHPASLLTALLGDLYGAAARYWGPQSWEWDPSDLSLSQNMTQLYVGAVPALVVVTVGLTRRILFAREVRFYALAALVLLIFALGRHTPAFRVVFDVLPGVALFRRPADATFLLGAMMGLLAAYGIHRLAMGTVPRAGWMVRAGEVAIVLAALVAGGLVAFARGEVAAAVAPLVTAVVWIAAAAAALCCLGRIDGVRRAGALTAAAALLMTTDLRHGNGPSHATALPAARYDILTLTCRNDTLALLKSLVRQPPGSPRRDRVELAGLGFEWPNAALVHGIDHDLGYNPLRIGVVNDAIGAEDTIAGPDQRRFTPLFPSYRSTLADLLGLRFIASGVPIEQIDEWIVPDDLRLIARTTDAWVYENPRALPRAMIVSDWQRANFGVMTRTGEWPADPREAVLLEVDPSEPAEAPSSEVAIAGRVPSARGAAIRRYENTLVEIEATTDRAGFLVLNDVWHPWWRAEIDGDPVPILKANVMFRAVQIPAGRSIVRFTFEPVRGAFAEVLANLSARRGSEVAMP